MFWFDLQDFMFLLKCLKDPEDNINIYRHITSVTSGTRATAHNQLRSNYNRTSTTRHFYFNRVVKLWNKVPSNILNLSLSLGTLKAHLQHPWSIFIANFNPDRVCTYQLITPHACARGKVIRRVIVVVVVVVHKKSPDLGI